VRISLFPRYTSIETASVEAAALATSSLTVSTLPRTSRASVSVYLADCSDASGVTVPLVTLSVTLELPLLVLLFALVAPPLVPAGAPFGETGTTPGEVPH